MSNTRHHAIIVTTWDDAHIVTAWQKAEEIFGEDVTNIIVAKVNNTHSFMIGPDGSNDGWPESAEGDARRQQFKNWIRESKLHLHVVEVQYADEEGRNYVKTVR